MEITFFQRKPIPDFHFSVEIIFNDVKNALPNCINQKTVISKYLSQGFFKRVYNCIEAYFNKSDINHVTGDINYLSIILPKKKTIHTILDCVFLENRSGIKKRVLKYFWLVLPVKKSKYVTTISNQVKKEIIKHTNCNPDKIKVIHIALSPQYLKLENKIFNMHLPNILITGSAPNKNIPLMLEALKNIHCSITIVGKKIEKYESILKTLGKSYQYLSGLSQEQMLQTYYNTDILLFASTYEGFGMPIIEAQAVGVPVITSNVSSMPEIGGNAALFVNPNDVNSITLAVNKIITDAKTRNELIVNGFENIKRFDINKLVKQYINLYQNINK